MQITSKRTGKTQEVDPETWTAMVRSGSARAWTPTAEPKVEKVETPTATQKFLGKKETPTPAPKKGGKRTRQVVEETPDLGASNSEPGEFADSTETEFNTDN